MNSEEISLFGILFTALVTIVGWVYTASIQKRILNETRKSEYFKRELEVFRERLSTVRYITSALVDQSTAYFEFTAKFSTQDFDFDSGTQLVHELVERNKDILKIIFDPAYRQIRNLLPNKADHDISEKFKVMDETILAFNKSCVGLNLADTKLRERYINLAKQSLDIGRIINDLADTIAHEYSILDRSIEGKSAPQMSIMQRISRKFRKDLK